MLRHLLFAHYYDMPIKFTDKEVEKIYLKQYDTKNIGYIKKSDALQISKIEYNMFRFNEHIVNLRYDLENFNITYISDGNFEKCINLKYFKFPHTVTRTKLGFRKNTNLQVIDVNEENTDFMFGTNCFIGANSLKALVLRQKFAFRVPEPIYIYFMRQKLQMVLKYMLEMNQQNNLNHSLIINHIQPHLDHLVNTMKIFNYITYLLTQTSR